MTCIATDAQGNIGRCNFAVTVEESVPELRIQRQGGSVVISWPVTCATYALEQTGNLNLPISWVPANGALTVLGNRFRVTIPILPNDAHRFYRLKRILPP